MSSIFGTTFGFLFPYALLTAPLLLAMLVYAYLRRGQGARKPVATVLLLRQLQRYSTARKKFVPPFRFFFELLLLTLLLLGAAGLFKEDPKRQFAVLIDNSFSMAALNPEDIAGENRLAAARKLAARLIDAMPGDAQVELWSTSPQLASQTSGLVTKGEVSEKLDEIEFAYAADRLDAALNRLAANALYSRILVVTDKTAPAGGRAAPSSPEVDPRFEIRTVGSSASRSRPQNIAVSELILRKPSLGSQKSELVVSVSSYALQQADVTLVLEAVTSPAAPNELVPAGERKLTLEPQVVEQATFSDLPAEASAFRAKLRINSPAASKLNMIKEDDSAWISTRSSAAEVLVVSRLSPEALGLNQIRSLAPKHTEPEGFDDYIKEHPPAAGAVLIFHRFAPPALPGQNSLFILPPADSRIFPGQPETAAAEITRWQESNPIVSYLNLPALSLTRLSPLEAPAWTETIISTTAGPALIAGERGEHRYAAAGFELLPYEGKKSPILSILTLNLLSWLSSGGLNFGYQHAGYALPLESGIISVRYVNGPELYRRALSAPAATGKALPLLQTGLVQVNNEDGTARLTAVDFFDEQESNLLTAAPAALPRLHSTRADSLQKNLFTRPLALLALLLCVLEILTITRVFGLWRHAAG